jgi:DNA-binding response OmpR family regulator
MITAESKTENVIAAKKAGVNNYIVKPFNAATLKTKIEAVPGHGNGVSAVASRIASIFVMPGLSRASTFMVRQGQDGWPGQARP